MCALVLGVGLSIAQPPVSIDPTNPWNETRCQLQAGHQYLFTAEVDTKFGPYLDKTIPCTPDGPSNSKGRFMDWLARDARHWWNPAHWIGPGKVKRLRVLEDPESHIKAHFLTIIGAIGMDDSGKNVFVIGSRRRKIIHADGPLYVFSNDWPGGPGEAGPCRFENSESYANNKGRIILTVQDLGIPSGTGLK